MTRRTPYNSLQCTPPHQLSILSMLGAGKVPMFFFMYLQKGGNFLLPDCHGPFVASPPFAPPATSSPNLFRLASAALLEEKKKNGGLNGWRLRRCKLWAFWIISSLDIQVPLPRPHPHPNPHPPPTTTPTHHPNPPPTLPPSQTLAGSGFFFPARCSAAARGEEGWMIEWFALPGKVDVTFRIGLACWFLGVLNMYILDGSERFTLA